MSLRACASVCLFVVAAAHAGGFQALGRQLDDQPARISGSSSQQTAPKARPPAETQAKIDREVARIQSDSSVPEGSKNALAEEVRAVANLYSPNPSARATQANYLKNTKLAELFIPELVALLNDATPLQWQDFRGQTNFGATSPGNEAAETLGRIGQPALGALLQGWTAGNATFHTHASMAITWILEHDDALLEASRDDPRIIEALLHCLRQHVYRRREIVPANAWAAEALGKTKVTQAAGALVVALKDESGGVRFEAAKALGLLRAPEATPALLALLQDEDRSLRTAAVVALGRIGDPRAVDPLLAIVNRSVPGRMGSPEVEAVEALGRIGDRRAIEPLVQRLSAEQDLGGGLGANYCVAALRALTGQDFGNDAARWREWLKVGKHVSDAA